MIIVGEKEACMTAMEAALDEFRAHFGYKPDGVWEAPGRVNLIGEHTDYNGGLVLPIALPQRTYVALSSRSDNFMRLASTGRDQASLINLTRITRGHPNGWERYPAGVLWALKQRGYDICGVDATFASEVPIGSGLSSSAAIEGAMAVAASDVFNLGLLEDDNGRTILANLCQQAENEIAGAPTGGMDQAAALRSRKGYALFLDCADSSVRHIRFDLAAYGLTLLIIDTEVTHSHSTGKYGYRRADCERACEQLGVSSLREIRMTDLPWILPKLSSPILQKRVRHVVTEIERVRLAVQAIQAEDYLELGKLFQDSHVSLRDDYEVSCHELDLAVVSALEAGALGARMTGGGFGGCAIALVYTQALEATQESIRRTFSKRGYHMPSFLVADPASPARRTEI